MAWDARGVLRGQRPWSRVLPPRVLPTNATKSQLHPHPAQYYCRCLLVLRVACPTYLTLLVMVV
jgi:hypothetical protein